MASLRTIKPCPSSKNAFFQNKAKFNLKVSFICKRVKKSFAFPLKQRRQETRKWLIYQGSFGLREAGWC